MKCKLVFSYGQQSYGDIVTEGQNFSVSYDIDGDKCLLEYKNGVLTQRRSGSVCLFLEFKEGEESECVIGEGDMSGKLPLFCERLKISVHGGGADICLKYLLGGEKTALNINIIY